MPTLRALAHCEHQVCSRPPHTRTCATHAILTIMVEMLTNVYFRALFAAGEACPICFEELEGEQCDYCRRSCGKTVHGECFLRWATARRDAWGAATCPYCRAPWSER